MADRVDTTANVFMGLTMGCARCHDHKYDPISQKDYYRFFAFFNTIAEKGLDGQQRQCRARSSKCPPPSRPARSRGCSRRSPSTRRRCPKRRRSRCSPRGRRRASPLCPKPPRDGLLAHYAFDGNLADSPAIIATAARSRATTPFGAGRPGQSASFNGEAHVEFPGLPGRPLSRSRSGCAAARMPRDDACSKADPGSTSASRNRIRSRMASAARRSTSNSRAAAGTAATIVFGTQWHHVALNFENGKPALLPRRQTRRDGRRSGQAAPQPAGPLAIGDPHQRQAAQRRYRRPAHLRPPADAGRGRNAGARTSRSAPSWRTEESKRTKDQKQRLLDYFLTLRRARAICAASTPS